MSEEASKSDLSTLYDFRYPHLTVVCIALFVSFCLFKAMAPFTPFFATDLKVPYHEAVIISSSADVGTVLSVFVTPLMLPFRVNWVMLSLCVVAGVVAALSAIPFGPATFGILVPLRIIFGTCSLSLYNWATVAATIFMPPSQRIRGCAMVEAGWSVGSSAFIFVGLILQNLGYQYVFIILGLPLIPLGLWTLYVVPSALTYDENDADQSEASFWDNLFLVVSVIGHGPCALQGSAILAVSLANGMLYTTLGVYLQTTLGLAVSQVGYISTAVGIGEFISAVLILTWEDVFTPWWTVTICPLAVASGAFGIGMLARFGVSNAVGIFFLIMAMGFGMEGTYLRAFFLIVDAAPNDRIGTGAVSFGVACWGVGMVVGGMIIPALLPLGFTAMFMIMAVLGLISSLLYVSAWQLFPGGRVTVVDADASNSAEVVGPNVHETKPLLGSDQL